MDPTGCHAIMNCSVMLSDLEPLQNAVDDSTANSARRSWPFRKRIRLRTPRSGSEASGHRFAIGTVDGRQITK